MKPLENVKKSWSWSGMSREIQTEMFRKSIHMLIGMVPLMARLHLGLTQLVLALGIVVYAVAEVARYYGHSIPLISEITRQASRSRDQNKMVLGPLTLGLGALLCLMLYPSPAAAVGIYALAFGDGLSSLVGKLVGRIRLPFTGGKTLEGSLTAFGAILTAALIQSQDWGKSLVVATVGTLLEALPLEDLDNLVIPLGTGLTFALVLMI